MKRFNRSVLAAVVAGGLCGGVGFVEFVHAGASASAQPIQRLDDQHWKHPTMHHALDKLKNAKTELDKAEEIFQGHRVEAIGHVDKAIDEINAGLKEQNDQASMPGENPSLNKLEVKYEHMHNALTLLQDARKDLETSDKIFQGHRDTAMKETDAAIKQVDDGIKAAEK